MEEPVEPASQSHMNAVQEVEQRRIRALLGTQMEFARSLHADAYQLVSPLGVLLTKDQYLGALAAGALQYLAAGQHRHRHSGHLVQVHELRQFVDQPSLHICHRAHGNLRTLGVKRSNQL